MLHLGHLNIFHLFSKIPDLCAFLSRSTPLYHIFGVSESRLTDHIEDAVIDIPNYYMFRKDKISTGETGLAIYIHHSIYHSIVRRQDFESKFVECMWLEYKEEHKAPIFICFLYRNPDEKADWFTYYADMMDSVYSTYPETEVLLLGDFNIDLFSSHPQWTRICDSLGLSQLIQSPTRITASSSTLIDHIYTNNPKVITKSYVSNLSVSDHYPISCIRSPPQSRNNRKPHSYITFRSFKHFDQNAFASDLSTAPFSSVYDYSDPDLALATWYRTFLTIVDKHAPHRTKRVRQQQLPPWLSSNIIETMAKRDKLKRLKRFDDYKKMRNKVKNLVRDAKREYFNKLVENNTNTKQLWTAINELTRGPKSKISTSIPQSLSAETFNNYFLSSASNLASENHPFKSPDNSYICSETLIEFCQQHTNGNLQFKIPFIATFEVVKYLSALPNKKSTGSDTLNTNLLKIALPYIYETLTYIFTLCIDQNYFPRLFKTAKVIPLPKCKDTSQLNNYRPISLLPVISKILEKHIHIHLSKHLENQSLFHSLQSGYRSKHSCSTSLAQLTNTWLSAINDSSMSGAVFLDLSKAFDLVNHSVLMNKLSYYLPKSTSLPFFASYLSDRQQYTHVHGLTSSIKPVAFGVPQGSVLGPLLFCLFINDLPLSITDTSVVCHMLADDTTISTSKKSLPLIETSLQKSIDKIANWCQYNHMCINIAKTKSMIITTRQKHQLTPLRLNLTLSGKNIEHVSEHKLLGVTIDQSLRWHVHIDSIAKKVSRNLYLFSRLQHILNYQAKKLYFYAYILSHINYASIIWDECSENVIKGLNSLHRRAAKITLQDQNLSTEEKFKSIGILPLQKQLLYNKSIFMFKTFDPGAPDYLKALFVPSPSPYSNSRNSLACTTPRIDLFKTSIGYSGALLWNTLPHNLKQKSSLSSFKHALFGFLETNE